MHVRAAHTSIYIYIYSKEGEEQVEAETKQRQRKKPADCENINAKVIKTHDGIYF